MEVPTLSPRRCFMTDLAVSRTPWLAVAPAAAGILCLAASAVTGNLALWASVGMAFLALAVVVYFSTRGSQALSVARTRSY
jgi:hypothetical protein